MAEVEGAVVERRAESWRSTWRGWAALKASCGLDEDEESRIEGGKKEKKDEIGGGERKEKGEG